MADTWIHTPTRTVIGTGALARLSGLASELGNRALIVTEGIFEEWCIIAAVKEALENGNIRSISFTEISDASTSSSAEAAAKIARTGQAQFIIGVGGVRTLSIAKAAAKIARTGQPLDSALSGEPFEEGGLPYIEVWTTCRNPFLFTDQVILVDARDRTAKMLNTGHYAHGAVIDPQLARSLGKKLTSTTMLDTLLLALEVFVSKKSNFFSDTLILQIFRPLLFSLKNAAAEPANLEYRSMAAEHGLLTSLALSSSSMGLGSAIGFALNGKFAVPHSWISAVMLPYILEWVNSVAPERIARIAEAVQQDKLGTPLKTGEDLIAVLRHTVASLRLPMRLHALDIEFRKILTCIPAIRQLGGTSYLPASITEDEIQHILKQAY